MLQGERPIIAVSLKEPEKHCIWLDITDSTQYSLKAFYPELGRWDYFYSDINMQLVIDYVDNFYLTTIVPELDDLQDQIDDKIDKVVGVENTVPIFDIDGNLVASVITQRDTPTPTIDVEFGLSVGQTIDALGGINSEGDIIVSNGGNILVDGDITGNNLSGTNTGDETDLSIIAALGYTPADEADVVNLTDSVVDLENRMTLVEDDILVLQTGLYWQPQVTSTPGSEITDLEAEYPTAVSGWVANVDNGVDVIAYLFDGLTWNIWRGGSTGADPMTSAVLDGWQSKENFTKVAALNENIAVVMDYDDGVDNSKRVTVAGLNLFANNQEIIGSYTIVEKFAEVDDDLSRIEDDINDLQTVDAGLLSRIQALEAITSVTKNKVLYTTTQIFNTSLSVGVSAINLASCPDYDFSTIDPNTYKIVVTIATPAIPAIYNIVNPVVLTGITYPPFGGTIVNFGFRTTNTAPIGTITYNVTIISII